MRTFFDSLALAKRYVAEPGTDHVLLRCSEAETIVLAIVAVPELVSAFNRLRREGALDNRQYRRLKSELAADIEQATIVDLTPPVIATAVDALERFALRTPDALHVAAAVTQGPVRLLRSKTVCRGPGARSRRGGDQELSGVSPPGAGRRGGSSSGAPVDAGPAARVPGADA